MAFICLRIPPLLFMPLWSSAALSLAPLALSASLAAPQFSAASGGAPLASARSALSPSYLRIPRLASQSSTFPSFAGWSSDSVGLRWPSCCYAFIRWPSGSFCGSGASSVVGLMRGPQPVALRSLNVRQSVLPPFLIVFPPGFSSIDAGMYVRAAALHRRSPPLSAVLPSEGDAVGSPMPRCHGIRVYVLHGEGCGLLLGVTTIALYVSFG